MPFTVETSSTSYRIENLFNDLLTNNKKSLETNYFPITWLFNHTDEILKCLRQDNNTIQWFKSHLSQFIINNKDNLMPNAEGFLNFFRASLGKNTFLAVIMLPVVDIQKAFVMAAKADDWEVLFHAVKPGN